MTQVATLERFIWGRTYTLRSKVSGMVFTGHRSTFQHPLKPKGPFLTGKDTNGMPCHLYINDALYNNWEILSSTKRVPAQC